MIETSDIISPPSQQEPNTTPTPQQSSHQPNPSLTLAIAPPLPPPNRNDYSILSSYHSDIYGPNAILQPQVALPQPQLVTTRYGRTVRAPHRYPEFWIDREHRSNQYPKYLYDHDVHKLPAVNDSQNQRPQLMDIDEESDDGILMAIHQVYSVSLGLEEELKTFNQALNSADVQHWEAAMKVEMDALN